MYILVAVAIGGVGGGGGGDRRVWSHEFRTRESAEVCMEWLKGITGLAVNIFDDFKEQGEEE